MPDVFINYRTGDGESVATLIERDLSTRFGREKIFRASQSIEAGEAFPQRILGAVHGSRALLSVIGARWADMCDAKGRQLLDNEDDWVRRELIEARKYDVRIIPVLVGDSAVRLDRLQLPTTLSWLRDLQYRRFSSRDADASLNRIANDLITFVPGLGRRTGRDHTTDAQVGQGNVTLISNNPGPVHVGEGHQINATTAYIEARWGKR